MQHLENSVVRNNLSCFEKLYVIVPPYNCHTKANTHNLLAKIVANALNYLSYQIRITSDFVWNIARLKDSLL